jgi:hypothetical protein
MSFLQNMLTVMDGKVHTADETYTYNTQSEYWEGYANQKYVVIDDMFKEEDIAIRLKQAADVIGMVNTVPFALNMAFGSKGHVYFNSSYVMCTTNIANDGYKQSTFQAGLTDAEAIKRRFHVIAHRTEKLGANLQDATFVISKCDMIPNVVDKALTPPQLAMLLHRLKRMQSEAFQSQIVTASEMESIIAQTNTDFLTTSGDLKPLNPVRIITYMVDLVKTTPFFSKPENLTFFIVCFFVLVALASFGPLYKHFFQDTVSPESKDLRQKGQGQRKIAKLRLEKMQFDTHSRVESYERCLDASLSKSLIYMCMMGYENDTKVVCEAAVGFHLRDGFICVPAHFFLRFVDLSRSMVHMKWDRGTVQFARPTNYAQYADEDIVVFQVPVRGDLPPASYKFFLPSDKYSELVPNTAVELFVVDENAQFTKRTMFKMDYNTGIEYSSISHVFLLESPLVYFGETQQGESGSIMTTIAVDGSVQAIGMHVGKMTRSGKAIGVSVVIWRELIDALIGSLDPRQSEPFPHEVQGVVPSSRSHVFPTVSQIHRSDMFDYIPDPAHKIPAPLRDPDGPSPIYKAMKKQHQVFTPETEIPTDVYEYLDHHYPKIDQRRVLNYEEALNGHEVAGALSVNAGTSPGYPYSLTRTKGKAPHIIRDRDDKLHYSPTFLDEVTRCHQKLKAGEQIEVLWAVFLKDELRLPEKVAEKKTRMVSACPLHYLILVRMYFLDFVLYVQSRAAEHQVSVGLNTASLDWLVIYKRIVSKGGSVISGDYENYDGRLPAFVGRAVVRFINSWYDDGPENARARELLFEHITNATHICYEKIYQVCDGNPSGNPITSIYNSFGGIIMVYIVLTRDLGMSPVDFDMVVYGDDNLIGTKASGVRCTTLAPHLKKRFGMTYTHCSKEEHDFDDTIDDVTYLGRSFSMVGGHLRCPLDIRVVKNIPRWISGDVDKSIVYASQADSFFRELSHFPRAVFEQWSTALVDYVKVHKPQYFDIISKKKYPYSYYVNEMYGGDGRPEQFTLTSKILLTQPGGFKTIESIFTDTTIAGTNSSVDTTTNDQFNDRAANGVEPTQTEQLGTFSDATAVKRTALNPTLFGPGNNTFNMEVFDLNKALDRQYLLSTLSWTTAQAAGTTLGTWKFPDALFQIPFIKSKVQDFTMFRAGIRVGIRIQASRFLYGRVMLYYRPTDSTNAFASLASNIYTASGYPHVIASASSGDTVFFDIPFISPSRMIDVAAAAADAMGNYTLLVMTPLININGVVDTATVLVTAQFLEAHVAVPCATVVPTSRVCLDFQTTSSRHEAVTKSIKGVLSSQYAEKVKPAGTIKTPSFIAPYASLFSSLVSAVKTGATIAAIAGLDKPSSVSAPSRVDTMPVPNFGYGKGIDMGVKAAISPEAGISTTPMIAGIDFDEMDIKYITGTPMMTSQFALLAATPTTLVASTNPTAIINPYTYVDFITRLFLFTSGSIKIKGYITASLMHSVRLAFFLARSTAADWQSSYHQIIDVQGDTEFEFTIPYLGLNPLQFQDGADFWNVYVSVISFSQPVPGTSAPIYLSIYKAGASDMKFTYQRDVQFTMTSNPREDFAKVFQPFHDSMVGYEPDNIMYPEHVTNLRDLVHRMTPKNTVTTTGWHHPFQYIGNVGTPGNDLGMGSNVNGVELLGLIFAYWRGSMRVQLIRNTTTPLCGLMAGRQTPSLTMEYTQGLCLSSTTAPHPTLETPYYADGYYLSTTTAAPAANFVRMTSTVQAMWCNAAGDDFSFHFLRPPPNGILGPSVAGYASLYTSLANATGV